MLPSILPSLALLASLAAAAPSPQSDSNALHIPIVRRASARRAGPEADTAFYAGVAASIKAKYGFAPADSNPRRAQTTDIGITNQGADTSYFAQVSVGTPGQQFNLVLDTGSSDLWFATSQCSNCPAGTPELDTTKSSSLQASNQPVSLRYGSGEASGTLAQDTVTMGPFTVAQQTFVAVDSISSGLIDGELAGIMGLAFQGIAASGALPFWQALANGNQFTSPEFAFFITRFVNDPSAANEEPGGVLTLGGTNQTLFQGNIDFQTFSPPSGGGSFWLQTVTGVNVNGNAVSVAGGDAALAAIDTGTTLIGGPTAAVNAIWGAVSGSQALGGNMAGFFSFPCNTKLTVSISFGGPSWPVSIEDLNLGTVSGGQCLGGIFDITQGTNVQPGQGNPSWIVGDTFLKNVYSVYRASPPAVGFAQLSDAAGGSSGPPSSSSGTSSSSSSSEISSSSSSGPPNTFSSVPLPGTPGPVTGPAKVSNTGLPTPSAGGQSAAAPLSVPRGALAAVLGALLGGALVLA
ncbi:aspartic peptidase domain-containing protein [Gloeopeniophorella convolvens]|nr:aspartic peptidase domain-containing protein [Gloeopeniophorella convolvens]